jgi:hypothetical protein
MPFWQELSARTSLCICFMKHLSVPLLTQCPSHHRGSRACQHLHATKKSLNKNSPKEPGNFMHSPPSLYLQQRGLLDQAQEQPASCPPGRLRRLCCLLALLFAAQPRSMPAQARVWTQHLLLGRLCHAMSI